MRWFQILSLLILVSTPCIAGDRVSEFYKAIEQHNYSEAEKLLSEADVQRELRNIKNAMKILPQVIGSSLIEKQLSLPASERRNLMGEAQKFVEAFINSPFYTPLSTDISGLSKGKYAYHPDLLPFLRQVVRNGAFGMEGDINRSRSLLFRNPSWKNGYTVLGSWSRSVTNVRTAQQAEVFIEGFRYLESIGANAFEFDSQGEHRSTSVLRTIAEELEAKQKRLDILPENARTFKARDHSNDLDLKLGKGECDFLDSGMPF